MAFAVSKRPRSLERRQFARFLVDGWFPDLVARVRPGLPARVREVATGGCVIDTNRSLLPGVRVELAVTSGFGRQLIRGRVVRCSVGQVSATTITFSAALQFDDEVDWHQLIPALTWIESEPVVTDTNGH